MEQRRRKPVTDEFGNRHCNECGLDKPLSEFYQRKDTGWYYRKCKKCHNDLTGAHDRQRRLDNPKPRGRRRVDHGPCAFDGCERKAKCRYNGGVPWYCMSHYQQLYEGRELSPLREQQKSDIDDRYRRCTTCQRVKTQESFNMHSNKVRRQSECKECSYLRIRFNLFLRQGKVEEAAQVHEKMPSKMQQKMTERLQAAQKN